MLNEVIVINSDRESYVKICCSNPRETSNIQGENFQHRIVRIAITIYLSYFSKLTALTNLLESQDIDHKALLDGSAEVNDALAQGG